jgi:hypothetical protein
MLSCAAKRHSVNDMRVIKMLMIVKTTFLDEEICFCCDGTPVLVTEVTFGSQDAEVGDALVYIDKSTYK